MARILGIDPGSRVTGYGLIEYKDNRISHIDCGGIIPPTKLPLEKRLQFIFEHTKNLITDGKPDFAAVEDLFVAKNAKSSLMLGHVRGVVLLALTELNVPYSPYTPKEVKKAITGNGNASKEQVQYMVRQLLKLKEAPFEDASDALAIAICHSNGINLQKRLKK